VKKWRSFDHLDSVLLRSVVLRVWGIFVRCAAYNLFAITGFWHCKFYYVRSKRVMEHEVCTTYRTSDGYFYTSAANNTRRRQNVFRSSIQLVSVCLLATSHKNYSNFYQMYLWTRNNGLKFRSLLLLDPDIQIF